MKYFVCKSLCLLIWLTFQMTFSQNDPQPVYVIVHGAWGGGWAFKQVDSLLTEKGALVYRPTLTGQGERVHLATSDVGLDTHINDVVNTILFEDLHSVVLVGHSYGGMVVTGVADRVADRIKKLIYVDAFCPENGESVVSITGDFTANGMKKVDGYVVPPWVPEGQSPPKDVPHPFKTFTDTLVLTGMHSMKIPTSYLLTVDKGKTPSEDDFASQAERAKQKGWPVLVLEADHNAQWSAPVAFAQMLWDLGTEKK